jgi:hypothetical protein
MDERGDRPYERPLIEAENLMTGGFQTGTYDAAPRVKTGESAALWSLVFGVLWIGGIGSLIAVPMALLALSSGDIDPRRRRMAVAALALAAAGVVGGAVIAWNAL